MRNIACFIGKFKSGGEGGIRTPGTGFSQYNGLANRRLQPLGHLSGTSGLQHCTLAPDLVTVPHGLAASPCPQRSWPRDGAAGHFSRFAGLC